MPSAGTASVVAPRASLPLATRATDTVLRFAGWRARERSCDLNAGRHADGPLRLAAVERTRSSSRVGPWRSGPAFAATATCGGGRSEASCTRIALGAASSCSLAAAANAGHTSTWTHPRSEDRDRTLLRRPLTRRPRLASRGVAAGTPANRTRRRASCPRCQGERGEWGLKKRRTTTTAPSAASRTTPQWSSSARRWGAKPALWRPLNSEESPTIESASTRSARGSTSRAYPNTPALPMMNAARVALAT